MSTTSDMPTITVEDENTFRIYAPRATWVDGGLSPDSLAIGDGRVLLGWVQRSHENPHTYFMPAIDECGWEVYRTSVTADCDTPPEPDENGPVGTLQTAPAREQLERLRANVKTALEYTQTTPRPNLTKQVSSPSAEEDQFSAGYNAARRHYGTGATHTLADIRTAAEAIQDEHPDGPTFYTELLDLIERRTRDWA